MHSINNPFFKIVNVFSQPNNYIIPGKGLLVTPEVALLFCGSHAVFTYSYAVDTRAYNFSYIWMFIAIVITVVVDIVLLKRPQVEEKVDDDTQHGRYV